MAREPVGAMKAARLFPPDRAGPGRAAPAIDVRAIMRQASMGNADSCPSYVEGGSDEQDARR